MFEHIIQIILIILCLILGLFLLSVFITWICCLFVKDKFYSKDSKFYRFLLYFWTGFLSKIIRIKVHVTGVENPPQGTRFLLVGNHRSNYDPILTWQTLKKYNISFISKKENFKIPFFGKIIRRCSFMEIDRENPRNAIKTINLASDLIKDDVASVAVYPEGTRSKTLELLEFHNGVFKIAQKANVPIVVLSILGTEKIHKNVIIRKSHVYIDILDVISVDEVQKLTTKEIGAKVREILVKKVQG